MTAPTTPTGTLTDAKQADIVLSRFDSGNGQLCVLANGAIRIEVGGLCITKTIAAWHAAGLAHPQGRGEPVAWRARVQNGTSAPYTWYGSTRDAVTQPATFCCGHDAEIELIPLYAAQGQVSASGLYAAIAHGDAKHRTWLREAVDAYFAGEPIPAQDAAPTASPPAGPTTSELPVDPKLGVSPVPPHAGQAMVKMSCIYRTECHDAAACAALGHCKGPGDPRESVSIEPHASADSAAVERDTCPDCGRVYIGDERRLRCGLTGGRAAPAPVPATFPGMYPSEQEAIAATPTASKQPASIVDIHVLIPEGPHDDGSDPAASPPAGAVAEPDARSDALVQRLREAFADLPIQEPDGSVSEADLRDAAYTHGQLWADAADRIEADAARIAEQTEEADKWYRNWADARTRAETAEGACNALTAARDQAVALLRELCEHPDCALALRKRARAFLATLDAKASDGEGDDETA